MLENDVVRGCLDYLRLIGIFAWRVNTMGTYRGEGAYSFNGMAGVSDIIGVLPQSVDCITEEGTVAATCGNILCIECKRPKEYGGKKPTNEQMSFLKRIKEDGGIALVVHSVDELKEQLEEHLYYCPLIAGRGRGDFDTPKHRSKSPA